MWTSLLIVVLALLVVPITGVKVVYPLYLHAVRERERDVLFATAQPFLARPTRSSEMAALPPPVQRYLHNVLSVGGRDIQTVWMHQEGSFREAEPASPWNPFDATQAVRTQPPGFIWDASIQIIPSVPVHVVDQYDERGGRLTARLAGAIPVMKGTPGPELDEGELLRYLAETPLYPTALLPGRGVTWTPIDDRSARATLVDGDTAVSLAFSFDAHDRVTRITGQRPFLKEDRTTEPRLWTGYWTDYVDQGEVRTPTKGEVAWVHPEGGEVSYWRARIVSIEYNSGLSTVPETASSSSRTVPEYEIGLMPTQ